MENVTYKVRLEMRGNAVGLDQCKVMHQVDSVMYWMRMKVVMISVRLCIERRASYTFRGWNVVGTS